MEINTSDIIAFIAVIISILSVGVHVVLFKISDSRSEESNRLASEANTTSSQALNIALFSHKKEIQPMFTAEYITDKDSNHVYIEFMIRNVSRGKAFIYYVEILTNRRAKLLDTEHKSFNYPIVIGQNQVEAFILKLEKIPADVWSFIVGQAPQNNVDEVKKALKFMAELAYLKIYFEDELGSKYQTVLHYKPDEGKFKHYLGVAEVYEKDLEHFTKA